MAAPTVREYVAAVDGLSGAAGSGTVVDDLVIVFTWEVSTSAIPTHTLQSGFTEFGTVTYNETPNFGRLSVAYKVATSGGAGSYQAYTSDSPATSYAVTAVVVVTAGTYSLVSPAWAIGTNSFTGTGVPNPPSVTGLSTQVEYLALAFAGWNVVGIGSVSPGAPSGFGNLTSYTGSEQTELAIADKTYTGVANIDAPGFTDDVTPNGSAFGSLIIPGLFDFTEGFEGGTAATTVLTGTKFNQLFTVSGSTITCETAAAFNGSLGGQWYMPSGVYALGFIPLLGSSESYVSVRGYWEADTFFTPSTSSYIASIASSGNIHRVWFRPTSSGSSTTLTYGRSGGSDGTTTETVNAGQRYRWEIVYDGPNLAYEIRLWTGATIDSADDADAVITMTGAMSNLSVAKIGVGPAASGSGSTATWYYDDLEYSLIGRVGPLAATSEDYSHSGSATLTMTPSGAATHDHPSSGTASLTLTPSAGTTVDFPVSGSATLGLTPSGAGTHDHAQSGTATLGLTATGDGFATVATEDYSHAGSATMGPLAASGAGTHDHEGSGSAAGSLAVDASGGISGALGAADTVLPLAAAGQISDKAVSAGADTVLDLTPTAYALKTVAGPGVAVLSLGVNGVGVSENSAETYATGSWPRPRQPAQWRQNDGDAWQGTQSSGWTTPTSDDAWQPAPTGQEGWV